jgi:hypothetical protein
MKKYGLGFGPTQRQCKKLAPRIATRSVGASTIAQRIRISRFDDGSGRCSSFEYEDAAEIQFSSRPGPQPIQSGAASRHPTGLQAETLDRVDGVARPRGIDRRSRAGVPRYASANAVTLTTPRRE